MFPTRDGGDWRQTHYQNWRRRRFNVAAEAAKLGGVTPYTLRHSFASLLLAEQMNVAEIAAQLGHSPQVCSRRTPTSWTTSAATTVPAQKTRFVLLRRPRLRQMLSIR